MNAFTLVAATLALAACGAKPESRSTVRDLSEPATVDTSVIAPGALVTLVETPAVKADLAKLAKALEKPLFKTLFEHGLAADSAFVSVGMLHGFVSCETSGEDSCDAALARLQSAPGVQFAELELIATTGGPAGVDLASFGSGISVQRGVIIGLTEQGAATNANALKALAAATETPTIKALKAVGFSATRAFTTVPMLSGHLDFAFSKADADDVLARVQNAAGVESADYDLIVSIGL